MSKPKKTPEKKSSRVLRGGSCGNFPQHARVASCFLDTPGNRSRNLGVRLIEVIGEQD